MKTKKEVETLIKIEEATIELLHGPLPGPTSHPGLEPAIALMTDHNSDVRKAAVTALGEINPLGGVAFAALSYALDDEDWSVRQRAADELDARGYLSVTRENPLPVRRLLRTEHLPDSEAWVDPSVGSLTRALLNDPYWYVRRDVASMLGGMGDLRAVEPLIAALRDDSDSRVRAYAAVALQRIGHKHAFGPLIAALNDPCSRVRQTVTKALVDLGPPAVMALTAALKHDYPEVRWRAATALAQIGDSRAVEPLIAALQDHGNFSMQFAAAKALGDIGDRRAVKPLVAALEADNSDVRWRAAKALGAIGDSRALQALDRALQDDHADVREAAADARRAIQNRLPPLAPQEVKARD